MEILVTILNGIGKALAAMVLAIASLLPGWNTQSTPVPVLAVPQVVPATTTSEVTQPAQANSLASPVVEPRGPQQDEGTRGLLPAPVASRPIIASTPAVSSPQKPVKSQEQVNAETRAALVNILCLPKVGMPRGVSGTGTIIDSRGVILTSAHIAQFFLLRDYRTADNVECVIRTGSPAENRYKAELLYLPPQWIHANATQLIAPTAMGTGQYDYALLRITGPTNPNASLPAEFPHLAMSLSEPDIGAPMLLAAYPAGFLSSELIQKTLYQSSAVAYVTQLFSFEDNTNKVELFSVGGTVLSQGGSSGGASVSLGSGSLVGVITTATAADETSQRDLRAMTIAYINEDLLARGLGGLANFLSGDLAAKAADFASNIAPQERAQLEAILDAQ